MAEYMKKSNSFIHWSTNGTKWTMGRDVSDTRRRHRQGNNFDCATAPQQHESDPLAAARKGQNSKVEDTAREPSLL